MGTFLSDILTGFGTGIATFVKSMVLAFIQSIDYMIYKTTTSTDGTVTVTTEYNTYVGLLLLILVVSFGFFLVNKFVVSPARALKKGK